MWHNSNITKFLIHEIGSKTNTREKHKVDSLKPSKVRKEYIVPALKMREICANVSKEMQSFVCVVEIALELHPIILYEATFICVARN